ncbi:ADP-forming succinate--CoA ligase subunit beta [[Haemophilus] felis]|uniref:Succinate--CoA ligase [ADP-forming] subunit beta n=1 Tax=[Haemophilus] felis TaxID=123822 RepID=A0A1T0BC65_9PAST|nr:ADP-forming succinate--CoA ligase subunit beta [[Haemophilus] felis]NBI40059.1 ADP-forming succinate--CoA ligase subunit beta [[Haemophilus] felis]OOS07664.1 succinate--CoA ligase subunit beta [[Haemophilus] felis]
MNLHEYQSKQLLADYQLPISNGIVCENVEQTLNALKQLKSKRWIAKCQVHAGGRGQAGGVQLISNSQEMQAFAQKWFGQRLVTFQTDAKGQLVSQIYVEECSEIKQELYFALTIDRCQQCVIAIASQAGGMSIEDVAQESPELIHKTPINALTGAMPYQGREIAFKLGLHGELVKQFTHIFLQAYKLFVEKDLALLEVNPLVITQDNRLLCLDAKIGIDNNALYRQPALKAMQDISQEDSREVVAEANQLNYVVLNGNIGCMVNGAGLAMATMDMVQLYGGKPANFLDVGGSATKQRVAEAFKLILSDAEVKAILVNIFGGIVSCDLIAEGIIGAVNDVGITIPVIARLEGNNAELGRQHLNQSGLNIIAANSLVEAVEQAVNAAEGQ